MNDVVDVALGKAHGQPGLLHLVEIEQLVDQVEQPVGVAVDHLQTVALGGKHRVARMVGHMAHDGLERTDDERHRGAYLVGYHGEETQTGLLHLQVLALVETAQLVVVAALGNLQAQVYVEPDGTHHHQQVDDAGGPAPPQGRMHHHGQAGLLAGPHAVAVGGAHTECVGARRQVGIGGRGLHGVVPRFVETLEHVGIAVLLGRTVAERSKVDGKHVVGCIDVELIGTGERLGQTVGAGSYRLSENVETGDDHRCLVGVDLHLIGIETAETVGGPEIDAAVGTLQGRRRAELFAGKAVVAVEHLQTVGGRILEDALVGREPEHARILHDGTDVVKGYLGGKMLKVVGVGAPHIDALRRGDQQAAVAGHTEVGDLAHGAGLTLGGGLVAVPAAAAVEPPQTVLLGSKPHVAALVFDDVERERLVFLHTAEGALGQVGQENAIDGAQPDAAAAVAAERIGAGRRTRHGGHRSGKGVHGQDALAIGAYPQIVAQRQEGVGVDGGQSLTGREIDHAAQRRHITVDTAVVGGHPDAVAAVLAEARHDVAAQQGGTLGGERPETAAHGRHIVHAAIERGIPQTTLVVADDAVDELGRRDGQRGAYGRGCGSRERAHRTVGRTVDKQTGVGTDQHRAVGMGQQGMDVVKTVVGRIEGAVRRDEAMTPCAIEERAVVETEHGHNGFLRHVVRQGTAKETARRLVELQHGLRTVLSQGIHLVAAVDIDTEQVAVGHPVVGQAGRTGRIAEETLPLGGYPDIAVAVGGKASDR